MTSREVAHMKIGIFSDMHGNALALDAVLADLERERVGQLVCLGDAVQGGPQPAEVVARLRDLGCPVVMGNADDWLLTGQDSGAETIDEARRTRMDAVRAWSLAQLSPDDLEFMATFVPSVTLPLDEGRTLLCFHGGPHSFDDVILPLTPDEEVRTMLRGTDAAFLCGGHTHVQQVRHFGPRVFFNPGSAGFAYRHAQDDAAFRTDPWAEHAILNVDGPHLSLDFRRVPLDHTRLVQVYRSSGRPFAEQDIEQLGTA